jgi:hypothetical protein
VVLEVGQEVILGEARPVGDELDVGAVVVGSRRLLLQHAIDAVAA